MTSHDRKLLGLPLFTRPSRAEVKAAYRRKARKLHPDAGGTAEAFSALHQAYHRVMAETPTCFECHDTGFITIKSALSSITIPCRH